MSREGQPPYSSSIVPEFEGRHTNLFAYPERGPWGNPGILATRMAAHSLTLLTCTNLVLLPILFEVEEQRRTYAWSLEFHIGLAIFVMASISWRMHFRRVPMAARRTL